MLPIYTQTPIEITKEVEALCQQLSPGQRPVFVGVTPIDHCKRGECFGNVAQQVAIDGGTRVLGWLIQVFPRVLAECEFHAIWRRDDAKLVDITPRIPFHPGVAAETVGLFLPDPSATYQGQKTSNILYSLASTPKAKAVAELSALFKDAFDAMDWVAADRYRQELVRRREALGWTPERRDPCPCGSRQRYGDCHGQG